MQACSTLVLCSTDLLSHLASILLCMMQRVCEARQARKKAMDLSRPCLMHRYGRLNLMLPELRPLFSVMATILPDKGYSAVLQVCDVSCSFF